MLFKQMKLKSYLPRLLLAIITLLLFTGCENKIEVKVIRNIEYGTYSLTEGEGKLLLDLYLPEIKASQPLPLLIYIHGGGWLQGKKEACPGKIVAQRRYIMACVSYRLSNQAIFPAQIHDIKKAVRWLRLNAEKYNIDPNKFGAWGESAGGHLSALLGTSAGVKSLEGEPKYPQISSNIQAVCDWYGPTDFTQVPAAFEEPFTDEVSEKYKNQPWLTYTIATHLLLGDSVSKKTELAALANPITHVDANDPPFLIVHGKLDKVVPLSQSELLAKALREKGVDVTLIKAPNLGHSYAGKGERFDSKLINRAIKFFNKHLR